MSLLHCLKYLKKDEFGQAVREYFNKEFSYAFIRAPASIHHHRNYEGGLLEHCIDVYSRYRCLLGVSNIPTFESDCMATALLHDVSKVFMYMQEYAPKPTISATYENHSSFPAIDFCAKTGVALPDDINSIILSHMGPWAEDKHHPTKPLEILFYTADHMSAVMNPPVNGSLWTLNNSFDVIEPKAIKLKGRSRNKNGRWRKKRNDAGTHRGVVFE